MSPTAFEDILLESLSSRPHSAAPATAKPPIQHQTADKTQLIMMDSPSVSSRRRRVRCRSTSSTSCAETARTEKRRRQTSQPSRPMALLLACILLLMAVEMPAPVSARLHEQNQQDIIQDENSPVVDAANFIDYNVGGDDIDSLTQQEAIIQSDQTQTQPQPQQDHRRLQEMKNEWPECIGMQAEDCVAMIESEAPDAYTLIVRPTDYDFHRIIIRVDSDSFVTKTPSRG